LSGVVPKSMTKDGTSWEAAMKSSMDTLYHVSPDLSIVQLALKMCEPQCLGF
jgi:hypothetical protein